MSAQVLPCRDAVLGTPRRLTPLRVPAQLSCVGVDEDSPYQTAYSLYLGEKHWKTWVAQRAFVALYIASHRGRLEAVQYLLEHGNSEILSAGGRWNFPEGSRKGPWLPCPTRRTGMFLPVPH